MKRTICIISENEKCYIFDIYLIKEKGKINDQNDYQIIDKIPLAYNKDQITNHKNINDFVNMLTKALSKHRYINTSLYISINIQSIIRDKFTFPKLSQLELKNQIDLELNKRYNNDFVKYYKKEIISNKIIINTLIFNNDIKQLIDNVFSNIKMKIKKISFQCENVNSLLTKVISDESYVFLYQDYNNYQIIITSKKEPLYTSTCTKENIITRIMSLYGYYSNIITNKIYTIIYEGDKIIIDKLKELGLEVNQLEYNRRIDIDSIIMRNTRDDYEKLII